MDPEHHQLLGHALGLCVERNAVTVPVAGERESTKPKPVVLPQKTEKDSTHTSSLMPQVRGGNQTAFEDLCCRYATAVAAYFRPYVKCVATVDDLTQEVFSRLWHKRERYRSGTPDLPYLLGFAEYVLKNHRDERNCKLNVRFDYDLRAVIDTAQSSPLDQTDLQDQIQELRKVLTLLSGAHGVTSQLSIVFRVFEMISRFCHPSLFSRCI